MYATICITVIGVAVVGLCGFVIYLWQKSAKQETKRLYAWLDDILDRINAGTLNDYAICRRIKFDMELQEIKLKKDIIEENAEKAKEPMHFVHQGR